MAIISPITRRSLGTSFATLLLASCTTTPPPTTPTGAETARSATEARALRSGFSIDKPQPRISVTAHPLASEAAEAMLARGGSPIDAAIAAQMVLGAVEPHASGIGGGTFILYWDARSRQLKGYDGLAAAPGRVTASLRTDTDGTLLPSDPSQRGGRTVGVPGTVAVFAMAHAKHGKLPWADLFAPAIRAAEEGFPLPPYLHSILALPGGAANHPDMRALYFGADGMLFPPGTTIRNPDYAKALRRIAASGERGFLDGAGAKAILASASRGFRPSLMTEEDLRAYKAEEREPVCAPFLAYRVCTMSPPSFGGLAVLQILQLVEARAGGRFDFANPDFVHLYAEAGRLAQADRRKYVGDPAFVSVPTRALADPAYVKARAALIDAGRARADHPAGEPLAKRAAEAPVLKKASALGALTPDESDPITTTSQLAVADANGNVVSVTTTLNLNFGSRLMADGFVLNNAMTNFSAAPKAGERIANQMEPGKRPVTSMAPTIVFDAKGEPILAGGSAGGGPIVDYIATGVIEILANGRTPREALTQPRLTTAVQGKLQLENGTSIQALTPALTAKGHAVEGATLLSGAGFIQRTPRGWIGAADPRRDGAGR